jgi:glucosyl-dolichyl phosphate glucuronosyltransferase
MKASVILPTRNRADTLARCLAALACQTLPADAFEVLVIDNGSTDHTRSVAQEYESVLNLTYANLPEPGLHAARHEGMRRAATGILMFADDDTEAVPGWVEAVVRTFENPHVTLVGGNNYPAFQETPPGWLMRLWENPVYRGRALSQLSILDFGEGGFSIDPAYVWGCNFSIRKDILLKVGGFHPDGFPESHMRFRGDGETHVANEVRRIGHLAVFNSKASVNHSVPSQRMTPEYFRKRSWAQGISDSYTAIRAGSVLGSYFGVLLRKWASMLRILSGRFTSDLEVLGIIRSNRASYWRGYAYHRQEVRADPQLKNWVLKDTYL